MPSLSRSAASTSTVSFGASRGSATMASKATAGAGAPSRTTTIAREPTPRGHALPISAKAERGPIFSRRAVGAHEGCTPSAGPAATAAAGAPSPPPRKNTSSPVEEPGRRSAAGGRTIARASRCPSPSKSPTSAITISRPPASSVMPFVCHEVDAGGATSAGSTSPGAASAAAISTAGSPASAALTACASAAGGT